MCNRELVARHRDVQIVLDRQRDGVVDRQDQFAVVNKLWQSGRVLQPRPGNIAAEIGRKNVGKRATIRVIEVGRFLRPGVFSAALPGRGLD